MNRCYCGNPLHLLVQLHGIAALGELACSTSPASYRGCYSAFFSYLWLQPAPRMHQGFSLLRQCKCTNFSFKFQFWQASHLQHQQCKFQISKFNSHLHKCHYSGESVATGNISQLPRMGDRHARGVRAIPLPLRF